ncbi:MAG TPA: hypothetical protein ENG55_01380 [Candidatus Omnitrophica bacterium]|nr:hypothetical protein [Candidatus Omnitrophota bacterium]
MFKRVSIFLLVVGLSFIYTQLSSADIVLLKTGMTLEGKIIEKTDDYVKIKTRSGIGTFKLDKVRGVVTDEEVPSATFPADIYRQRLNKIGENDAQAHYELGIFCLQNGLPDEAREEFNKAKEIDSEYEGRVKKQLVEVDKLKAEILYNCGIFFCKYGQPKRGIAYLEELIKTYPENDLVEKAEDLLAGVREENPLPQPLTLEEIKLKFKQGKLPIPIAKEDQENIVEFINKMPEDKKLYYCKRYLDIGEEYAAKIPLKESLDEKNKAHTTALYCYRIASKIALKEKDLKSQALNKMRSLSDELSQSVTHESIIKGKLPIPIPGKEMRY